MTARREHLAELDALTADLRDRTDAWCRQLRHVERTTLYSRGALVAPERQGSPGITRRRDRGRVAMAAQQATLAVILLLGLFLAAWPALHVEPTPATQVIRPATPAEVKAAELQRRPDLWRAELEQPSP